MSKSHTLVVVKGIITAENFGALMILYSEIWGHVLTPFLDTYPGTRKV